ncbi:MAG: enoyl-CoA hydratase/isomerase family protein [Comamonadaceae bacterium]|nr:MAG: enoyl-CoA hydratase/isomerase family protein [Comamonadaceae bacterium]
MPGEVVAAPAAGQAGAAGVVRVVLRHPGRLNAMSRAMWRELRAVFDDLQRRTDVRCVIVEGEGDAFCAGGDISEYPDFRFDPERLRDFHEGEVWGGLAAMLACDVPIVARIAGACMGAGVEIASCCDVRIAADTARFGAPIARLGFPMAPREAALVAGAVGVVTARQMLLEAATFDAGAMLQRGFLSRVVQADQLEHEAVASASRIAALAPGAARMNKQTLRALQSNHLPVDLPVDLPGAPENKALIAINKVANDFSAVADPYAYADSAEHREGIAAFLAKRPPVF